MGGKNGSCCECLICGMSRKWKREVIFMWCSEEVLMVTIERFLKLPQKNVVGYFNFAQESIVFGRENSTESCRDLCPLSLGNA